MTLNELKDHVSKLNALLEDYQPGLLAWRWQLNEHIKAISDDWTSDDKFIHETKDKR